MRLSENAGADGIEPPRGAELERFSEAIGSIYETALEPANWTAALGHINQLTGASQSVLHWGDMQTNTAIEVYHVGMSREFLDALRRNAFYWAMQVDALNWKAGDVHYLADLLPREELERGRFYREALKPFDQLDYIGMHALVDGHRLAALSVNRDVERGFFEPRAIELMRLIAPHVCRAARISAALDLRTIRSDMLNATLDSLACGVALIDNQRGVHYANDAAHRMFQKSGNLAVVNKKLKIADAEADAALGLAISGAASLKPQSPAAISIPDPSFPLAMTVMPISSGQRSQIIGMPEAAFAVFIQNLSRPSVVPREILVGTFGLTPAEVKVVMALLQGCDTGNTADILGITEATVRSHIKSIMSKVGVSRQADLVQMVLRAASPLAGAEA